MKNCAIDLGNTVILESIKIGKINITWETNVIYRTNYLIK